METAITDSTTEGLTISEQRLVEALQSAQREKENPQGALTTVQLSGIMGLGVETVRKYLRRLNERGMLARARIHEEDLAGRVMPKFAYRIKTGPLGAMEGSNEEGIKDERQ